MYFKYIKKMKLQLEPNAGSMRMQSQNNNFFFKLCPSGCKSELFLPLILQTVFVCEIQDENMEKHLTVEDGGGPAMVWVSNSF